MSKNLIVQKKICHFGLMTSFSTLNATYHTVNYMINKFSQEFVNFYIINTDHLILFNNEKHYYNFSNEVNTRPKNIILINPKNSHEFKNFMSGKKFVIINNFGRDFLSIRIHFLLKKMNVSQIQISNIGNIQMNQFLNYFYMLKFLNNFFFKKIFRKLIPLFSFFKIIPHVDIRFLSNLEIIESIQKNCVKNFFYKNNLFYAKKIVPVNSRVHDIFFSNNYKTSNEYIVHLDHYLNYSHETIIRGYLSEKKILKHVQKTEKCLINLSKNTKKKVVVCIHPLYPLEVFKKYYKDFKVVKFQTRFYICKAEVVTFWDSSSVVDAIFLKKKIISLYDEELSRNEFEHSKVYQKKLDLLKLNINYSDMFLDKNILEKLNSKILNYDNYIKKYHSLEKEVNGVDKIIRIIKENYFKL